MTSSVVDHCNLGLSLTIIACQRPTPNDNHGTTNACARPALDEKGYDYPNYMSTVFLLARWHVTNRSSPTYQDLFSSPGSERIRMLLYAHLNLARYGLLRHPLLSLFARGKLTAYEHQFFASPHGVQL
jgi:hypothetical protein